MPCISKNKLLRELESFDLETASEIVNNELEIISYKLQFINDYTNGKINTDCLPISEIIPKLERSHYPKLLETEIVMANVHEQLPFNSQLRVRKSYDYILKLPLSNMTSGTIKKILTNMKCVLDVLSFYNENKY